MGPVGGLDLFTRSGYTASAPGWPGDPATVEEARANPDALAGHGIDEVTEHYAQIVAQLPEPPILIGHSFGGMIAEKLLGQNLGAAAIAIHAAQIKGVLPLSLSSLRSTLPVFKNPANKHRAGSLTAEQFRYSFGNALEAAESDALHARWTIPAPGRPLFEAAAANLSRHSPAEVDTANESRGPLLLIMGGQDHTVPEAITNAQAVPALQCGDRSDRVRRSWSLADDRQWLARGRRRLPGLARQARALTPRDDQSAFRRAASWPREVMSSLGKMRYRCEPTVRWDRNSRCPISRLDNPSAASRAICSSCADRAS
jgi:pimeloyl-ACP methyl ester carboxylesterase